MQTAPTLLAGITALVRKDLLEMAAPVQVILIAVPILIPATEFSISFHGVLVVYCSFDAQSI